MTTTATTGGNVSLRLRQRALEHPERIAIQAPDGTTASFEELERRCDRLAHGLRELGLGCEAWELASGYLLEEVGLRKLTAGTLAENEPMLRIMRRCGMREEGRRRGQMLLDGRAVDLILGGRLRRARP